MLPLASGGDWIKEHLLDVEVWETFGLLGLSKHVLSLWIAGGLMVVLFLKAAGEDAPVPGRFRSAVESILIFLREDLARPFLKERTDRYMPVLWNFFFFILFCNMLGLVPWFATATGQIWVTGTLASMAFCWYHGAGIYEQGLIPYIKNIVPPGLPLVLVPFLFVLEMIGHLAKPFALMVRLWANMTGGHAVLYAIIGMVFTFSSVWFAIGPVAVLGATAIYMLELVVAFVQAYVFTFLVVVFLGGAVHPEH